MGLKERLARLEKTHSFHSATSKKPLTSTPPVLLPGKTVSNTCGSFRHNRLEYDLDHKHGNTALTQFFTEDSSCLGILFKNSSLNRIRLENLLFLDTETTGLSGGAGTLAFLIGIGYFNKGRFVIDQYFMSRFHEERAILNELAKHLRSILPPGGALVSFNGKAYDLPLLLNRSVFHRVSQFPVDLQHMDILFPARRLFKKFLPNCALQTLESHLLGVKRKGDVDSTRIPEIFFQFIRTSDPRPLLPVFYHNQMDILSMLTLLALMLKVFKLASTKQTVSADWMALGRMCEELNDYDSGILYYDAALKRNISGDEKQQIMLCQARIYKKKKNFEKAISLWLNAINCKRFLVEPFEELAKVYEHHLHDFDKARHYTERALKNVELLNQLEDRDDFFTRKDPLLWRLERIKRKLRRS